MSRRKHRTRTLAGVVNIEHPLRALVVAAIVAAVALMALGAIETQFRSAGEGSAITVTYDVADEAVTSIPLGQDPGRAHAV